MIAYLLLLFVDPHPPLVDHVDLIERNHVVCLKTGGDRLDQIIYWRWDNVTHGHRVVAWRMTRDRTSLLVRRGNGWRESWSDGEYRREIYARRYLETWTEHDPEVADRDVLAVEWREGLRVVPKPLATP